MAALRFSQLSRVFYVFFMLTSLAACDWGNNALVQPVSDAGPDQSVGSGAAVTLDGSGSTPSGGLTYAWTQTAGTPVVLSSSSAVMPTFTAPTVTATEVLTFELTITDQYNQTSTDSVDITVVDGGPTADAGADQVVAEGAAVTLDGTNSSHNSGGVIATYAWVQTAGSPVNNLAGADTANPTFDAPDVLADEVVTFELTVTDDDGDTDVDTVDITVQNDTAPVADAGADQSVDEGTTPVTLDGSASSDAVGAIATYAWAQTAGTAAALTNADTAMPTFTAPQVLAGGDTLTFELTVTDDAGQSDTDTVDVVVNNVNASPTADAGTDQLVGEGAAVNLDGTGSSDSDGSIATYAWTQTAGPAVTLTNPDTATPSFTAPLVSASATMTFSLTVTDDLGAQDADSVDVTINVFNAPPTANAGPDQTVEELTAVNLDGTGSSDIDGAIASYAWVQTAGPNAPLTNGNTATPNFAAPDVTTTQTLTFQLTVTDNDAVNPKQGTDTVNITVEPANVAPTADAGADQSVDEQSAVSLDGSGSSDSDGTIASYAWVQTAGTTVTLNNGTTATPGFTAPSVDVAGETLTFELTVTDDDGATATDTVDILVNNDPTLANPPTAVAGADQVVAATDVVTLDGSGSSDSDGTITAYSWTQTGGTAVTITNAGSAVASFTAPAAPATLTFQLEVTDDDAATGTDTITVRVNAPPAADAGTDQTVVAATTVTLDGTGSSDVDGTIASYAWTQTGGPAVTLTNADQASATITSPAAPNTLTFQLTVTDNDGVSDADSVVITVNSPPTANAGIDQSVDEQSAVNLTGAASSDTDGTIASYAWTQTAGTTVSLTGANTATPSFTAPSVDVAGDTLTFQLTVTDDDGATDSDSVDIQVNNDPTLSNPPTAVAGPDQVVSASDAVTLNGNGSSDSDGTITAYQWTQTGGTATVTLNNAGSAVASFTAPAAPDLLTFQLEVTDNDASTGTDTISIKVNAPPTANAGTDQSVDEQSSVNLTAAGSSDVDGTIASYAWTQTAGTAVVLTGAATATPSFTAPSVDVAGDSLTFEVTVTDEDGATDTDTVDVQVNNDPTLGNAPTAAAGSDQVVSATDTVTLDGTGSSDSDGTITAYQWTQTGGTATVTLNNAGTSVATFTAPAAPDLLTFQLEVTDDDAATGTDTISIKVNAPPVANAGPDQSVDEQSTVNLTGAASSDVDGTVASYAWSQTGGTTVTLTGANTATPSFTAPSVDATGETLTFSVTVTDEDGATDNDSVDVQVNNDPTLGNAPTAAAGSDQVVSATDTVTLDGTGSSDSDGTITAYQWTQTGGTATVTLNNAGTSVATFTAPAAPDLLTFQLEVTDNDAATGTDTISVKINAPPTANAGTDQSVDEETAVNLSGAGSSDVDGTIASYSWTQTAGTAVVLTGAGTATPSFTAPSVDLAGETLTFDLTVTDEDGASDSDTVDIQVDNDATLNIPPVAAAGPDQNVSASVTVTLDGTGSTDDTVITGYQWTQTAGTTVTITNAGQATASFTSPATSETMTFQLEVTDEEGGTNTDTVDVVVSAGPVTISGTITFHRVPHTGLGAGGLDYGATFAAPARLVTVQLIDAGDGTTVLDSDVTDTSGDYSMSVASSTDVFLRVVAEMVQAGPAPSWDFYVVDNTNADAQYVLDTAPFNSGGTNQTLNVNADTVFDGTDYTVRNGAIFAILDTVYDAFQEILVLEPATNFEPLALHWSVNNTPSAGGDPAAGEIGTSYYRGGDPIDGIYLLGEEDVDTEEYDKHVITHEFGHYLEDTLARSDSIGGAHGALDRLDIRVAFGEGFGNAWSAIPTNDTTYIDTQGSNQSLAGGMDIEDGTIWNGPNTAAGWFSERSVQETFYDLYDSNSDGADTLSLGFGPLWSVMTGPQSSTLAFTSIFSFVDALKTARPGDAAAIDALLASQSVDTVADEWGTGETNDAGVADSLPVYKTVTVGGPAVNVCSNDSFGGVNKLNTIQYVRFTITTAGMHDFSATATVIPAGETTDPDMWLRIPFIDPAGIYELFESEDANSESGTSSNFLPVGDYILEVFDFNNRSRSKLLSPVTGGPTIGRACFDITITGP